MAGVPVDNRCKTFTSQRLLLTHTSHLCKENQLRWFGCSLHSHVLPEGHTQDTLERSQLAWERLSVPMEELEEQAAEREILCLDCCTRDPDTDELHVDVCKESVFKVLLLHSDSCNLASGPNPD